jgi:hypothetical protein
MRQSAQQGENRTGIVIAGDRADAMMAATAEFLPSSEGSALAIAAVRTAYAQAGQSLGETPLLMDKLGERLVFEHAGARLYEALVSKHRAHGSFTGGPSEEDLVHILSEEYEHGDLLSRAIKDLDGDPTALTPSANLAANISAGLPQVLADPRTNLLQCLEAILVAELSDNECWTTLESLAAEAGKDDLATQCRNAITREREHLMKVRQWIAAGQGREMSDGAPMADDGEDFTFTEGSETDREGFVVSEEEAREGDPGPQATSRGAPRKPRKRT